MPRLRLASTASSTPHVYAPHDPPPCSARPTGLRPRTAEVNRVIGFFISRYRRMLQRTMQHMETSARFPIECCDRPHPPDGSLICTVVVGQSDAFVGGHRDVSVLTARFAILFDCWHRAAAFPLLARTAFPFHSK